jgi:CubicO group peptidase (beta-lactamase class C family)/alpha-beta hydrolase superfamily lysophospholipase
MIALAVLAAMSNPDFSAMTRRIDTWVERGYYKGAAMVVVKGGRTIYEKTFGNCTPNTVVLIASAGKWLAAATIASVVDQGRLSWGDRVDKWLPEFKDIKGSATLRQLLSHTSGYPDYQPKGVHVDDYDTLTESVSHIVDLPAVSRPGERFQYGGLAMQVAGRMAELATGKTWEALFEERIGGPLGMKSTRFVPIDKTGGHSPMLAGGARSTLANYSHFLDMILHDGVFHGRRILSENAIHEMQSDQVKDASMSEERYVARSTGELHNGVYGLGEWREQLDSKGNATLITSPSWAGALPWSDKKRDLYAFFIAHVDGSGPAWKEGFNPFYSSPILIDLVKRAVDRDGQGITTGRFDGLAYEEAGQGEPVILLHAHGVDRRMWDDQFALLSKNYRVIRYDMRGYGESDNPTEWAGFTHAEDLRALMDHLGIEKTNLVGLSLGALIAFDFLALHPDRVLSIVAAAGAIHDVERVETETPEEREARHARETAAKVAAQAEIRNHGLDWYRKEYLKGVDGATTDPATCRYHLWRMVDDWGVWQKTHIEGYPLLDLSVASLLKREMPKIPILLIVGAHDSVGSKQSSARLAAILPQAQTVFLENAGHFSNLEDPKVFDAAMTSFLAKVSPPRR